MRRVPSHRALHGFHGVALNSVFVAAFCAFALAQLLKVFTHW